MQFNTFFIPLADDGQTQDAQNSFLRSKRVLAVEKAFTGQGWSFCVEWLESGKLGLSGKPKVDYREVLSPEEFVLFSKLREKRRELAQRDGVQVYTIMTNEQLAEMVRQQVKDIAGLRKIDGVGEARIEKYGGDFLPLMGAVVDV
jgi:superfamily II DNA helicase RecQ